MPIQHIIIEGRVCPAIICNQCAKEITGAGLGNCFYDPERPGAVFFIHKDCTDSWEAGQTADMNFNELDVWLVYLLNGVKFHESEKDARERAALLASIQEDR